MNEIKNLIKENIKTLVFFAIVGLIGGFFVGIYALDGYPEEMRQELVRQISELGIPSLKPEIFIAAVTAFQSMAYGAILGAIGIFFAKKISLWKGERAITKKPLTVALISALIGGTVMILSDVLFFGRYSEVIMDSYASRPSAAYVIATVTYAAVIEEVMLRLLLMSCVAYVLNKIFGKGKSTPDTSVLICANVISAIIFAAAHLPATFILIGNSPIVIFRCFLLNGGMGAIFGYLYRKYGLRYAMISHGGSHIVSKLIWILFI